MAYCTRNDLLLGNIARPADAVLDVYVQNGSDTIDTKLGFRFTTPIVINTGIPGSNASVTLLKQLNVYLATGMFIVATSASAEDIQLNAYGRYLLTQAELALDAIASGDQILPGGTLLDPSDVQTSGPIINNLDDSSGVEDFYAYVRDPWHSGFTDGTWPPGSRRLLNGIGGG
jgi:hypothetical protein